jgi:WW domain-binding protein 4
MSSNRQQREPWRNAERHHCAVCNAWMGSDRQSIMLHENGKKHQENVEQSLQKKRADKAQEAKNQNFLQASLQKMEQAALQSHLQQDSSMMSSTTTTTTTEGSSSFRLQPSRVPSSMYPPVTVSSAPPPPPPPPPPSSSKQEKQEWESRKKKRRGGEEKSEDAGVKPKRRKIEPGEGHYENDGKIYLEGSTFLELLEEDMPVQIWTGSALANLQEKRLVERDLYWKHALVAAVRKRNTDTDETLCTVHVAYLASPEDTQETLEKNVPVDRIRMVLGSDESLPDTLEEARLLAMGGEEIQVKGQHKLAKVDEATGLSGWSTVKIKRTTVRQEFKEERARLREKRKEASTEKEAKEKEAEARRMEEAKVANADDSALGAYDVWGKGGYKGVDITNADATTTVADTAKSLGTGKGPVAFKKKKKKPASSRNRRRTSADDDD